MRKMDKMEKNGKNRKKYQEMTDKNLQNRDDLVSENEPFFAS